jgi:methylmalonyl-CoA/ethylmalonyl-CoA epimerase
MTMSGDLIDSALVSHVGIAVRNLDEAIAAYRLVTGSEPILIEDVPDQKVKVAMFASSPASGGRVELLQATADDSPIAGFIAKRGEGLHHICIYVGDIERRLAELKDAGVELIDETPRIGAEGNRIAFVHPRESHGVLIELEERKDSGAGS